MRAVLALDPTTARRTRRFVLFSTKLVFLPLVLLTTVALALHLGAWKKEYRIEGPFPAETSPARHSLILAVPQDMHPKWWMEPPLGDDSKHPHRSRLRLWVDGREIGLPHRQHEAIRNGSTAGFSHWGSTVLFSLPVGVKNVTAYGRPCGLP
jgi:hypothetical protein